MDRRSPISYVPAQPLNSHYPPRNHTYNGNQTGTAYPPFASQRASGPAPPLQLATLKMSLEPRYSSISSPSGPLPANRMAPPLPSPYEANRPGSYSSYGSSSIPALSDAPRSGKRPYDSVFSSSAFNQPLHNGQRPQSSHHNAPTPGSLYDDDDDGPSMEELRMQYKRADGSSHARALPNLL